MTVQCGFAGGRCGAKCGGNSSLPISIQAGGSRFFGYQGVSSVLRQWCNAQPVPSVRSAASQGRNERSVIHTLLRLPTASWWWCQAVTPYRLRVCRIRRFSSASLYQGGMVPTLNVSSQQGKTVSAFKQSGLLKKKGFH